MRCGLHAHPEVDGAERQHSPRQLTQHRPQHFIQTLLRRVQIPLAVRTARVRLSAWRGSLRPAVRRADQGKLRVGGGPAGCVARRLDLQQHAHAPPPREGSHPRDVRQAVLLVFLGRRCRQFRVGGGGELEGLGVGEMPVQDVIPQPAEQPDRPQQRVHGEEVVRRVEDEPSVREARPVAQAQHGQHRAGAPAVVGRLLLQEGGQRAQAVPQAEDRRRLQRDLRRAAGCVSGHGQAVALPPRRGRRRRDRRVPRLDVCAAVVDQLRPERGVGAVVGAATVAHGRDRGAEQPQLRRHGSPDVGGHPLQLVHQRRRDRRRGRAAAPVAAAVRLRLAGYAGGGYRGPGGERRVARGLGRAQPPHAQPLRGRCWWRRGQVELQSWRRCLPVRLARGRQQPQQQQAAYKAAEQRPQPPRAAPSPHRRGPPRTPRMLTCHTWYSYVMCCRLAWA